MTSSPSARLQSLIFEMTARCNFDCLHCYNVWKNRKPYHCDELPTAETLAMLDKILNETGIPHITLTGGEPLLREDWRDIVSHLLGRGTTVNLISNGSLLTEKNIQWLRGRKIGVFELPLLSCEREIHDRMSGFQGAFDRVTQAIADLKLAGEVVVTVFVATRLNLPTLAETIELAFALGVDGIMLNRFNPGGRGFENLDLLQASPEEMQEALAIAERLGKQFQIPISCSIAMPPCLFELKGFEHLTFGFCGAGTERAYFTMDPAGNIRPCNHSPTLLGNICDSSFDTIRESPALASFMTAHPAICGGCELEMKCLGGCKAAAEACYGSLSVPDPFLGTFQGRMKRVRP